jgi:nucleoid-associated protein YgaU
MALAKAQLVLVTQDGQPSIDVMFNPTDFQITRNMKYAEIEVPGLAMPLLQFIRGESQLLDLELFVDSSDRKAQDRGLAGAVAGAAAGAAGALGGVAGAVGAAAGAAAMTVVGNTGVNTARTPIDSWTNLGNSSFAENRLAALRLLGQIDSHLHAPHVVEFSWGGQVRFRGVVTMYREKFTLFDEAGHIQRARVTLQLKSFSDAGAQYAELNPQSPDRTKTHTVRAGERIDSIAAERYGDPSHWPVIAAANGLARPRVLVPGTLLLIPPLE